MRRLKNNGSLRAVNGSPQISKVPNSYWLWSTHKGYLLFGAQAIAGEFIATFKEFPPRQKPQTFNLDQVMQRLEKPAND